MTKTDSMPEIVYIAGYGRSGSTLLDLMLGSHSRIFGAGEICALPHELSIDGTCTCGKEYSKCDFWSKVISKIIFALPAFSPSVAAKVTKKLESPFNFRPHVLGSSKFDQDYYRQFWQTTLIAIGQESKRSIIVDSSKSSWAVSRRIRTLTKLCGFEIKLIHLIRDPRATMYSSLRGSNKLLQENSLKPIRHGAAFRSLLGWSMANISVHRTVKANNHLNVLELRYEELVHNPIRELHRLSHFLNLKMDSLIDHIINQNPLYPGHAIGGNRMRRCGPVKVNPDEEWKESLPLYAKALAILTWPISFKYGYNPFKN